MRSEIARRIGQSHEWKAKSELVGLYDSGEQYASDIHFLSRGNCITQNGSLNPHEAEAAQEWLLQSFKKLALSDFFNVSCPCIKTLMNLKI
jgi:hypothetical protein